MKGGNTIMCFTNVTLSHVDRHMFGAFKVESISKHPGFSQERRYFYD